MEASTTNYLRKRLTEHGLYYWKMSDRYNSGRPDVAIFHSGRAYFVEMKAPGKQATPLQYKIGRELSKRGVFWVVVDSQKLVDKLVDDITKGRVYGKQKEGTHQG